MFALLEIKEYWCIVSINDRKDDFRIMRVSDDLEKSEEYSVDDDNLEYANIYWIDRHQQEPGLYKLILEPTFEEPDEDGGEKVFDCLNTVSYEFLYKI
jgi:hypothetical protein